MNALPQTYSVDEVAAALGKKRKWLLYAAKAHPDTYPSLKVGGSVRFTEDHCKRILENLERRGGQPKTDSWGRRPRKAAS